MAKAATGTSAGAKKPPAKPKTPKAPKVTTTKATPNVPAVAPTGALARTTSKSKFTLYNLLGQPRSYYLVEPSALPVGAAKGGKSVAHSIIVVDRSGSMYSALAATKDTLLKVLTLDEYAQYDLIVTLLSYSGSGDVKCHFERVPIREIMKKDSQYQKDIKSIKTACMTCISQGLRMATEKLKDKELTAITLHSDGYANDPSSTSEAATLMKLCNDLKSKDAFVNTIGYGDYCDFRLLSRVANAGSGSAIKAGKIGDVYSSLYNSTKTLGSSVTPPVEVPLPKGAAYQVFVSRSGGRVLGSGETLSIRGLKAEDDGVVFKYTKLTKAEYDKSDAPVEQTGEAVFAFAKANLAEGNLNTAKYALASTYDATLVGGPRSQAALTNNQVAAMATDIDTLLTTDPAQLGTHTVLDHVPVNKKIPFLTLINLLDANRGNFVINRTALHGGVRAPRAETGAGRATRRRAN